MPDDTPVAPRNDRRLSQEGVNADAADRGVDDDRQGWWPLRTDDACSASSHARSRGGTDEGQALVHILFRATLDGLIVRGPMIGGEQAYVLVTDWLGERQGRS